MTVLNYNRRDLTSAIAKYKCRLLGRWCVVNPFVEPRIVHVLRVKWQPGNQHSCFPTAEVRLRRLYMFELCINLVFLILTSLIQLTQVFPNISNTTKLALESIFPFAKLT